MTSNEEIYNLTKNAKHFQTSGWTISAIAPKISRDYEDEDSYDDFEPDNERQAEIDETMLWDI